MLSIHVYSLYADATNRKPKNARSKRALQAREPKEVEDPRTAIFVKGTHAVEKVNAVMKEMVCHSLSLLFLASEIVFLRRWR